jgi:LmbE family N-acetylglucosaminyl deacetylase
VAAGADVQVVIMTNGDASELGVLLGERELSLSPSAYLELGHKRQQESLHALALLGLPRSHVHFLSYPNNGLAALWKPEHWLYSQRFTSPYTKASASPYARSFTPQAPYCGTQVLSDLISLLNQIRPTAIYVTHPRDIHPDHWAANAFVRYALATISARGGRWADSATVYGYMVHWPLYPSPSRMSVKLDLVPPSELAGPRAGWLRLELPAEVRQRKLKAVWAYRSQGPRFDRLLLRFARANESFALLPVTDMQIGTTSIWRDDKSRLHHLGGAEIRELALTLRPDHTVQAELQAAGRGLGKRSYLALDLRSWDESRAPVITNVSVSRGNALTGVRISGNREESIRSARVTVGPRGRLLLPGFDLPSGPARDRFFLTCWGSAGDRLVDGLVVSWVKLADGPTS